VGVEKEQMMEKEDNWRALANRRGWRCVGCGQILSREELQEFTDMCSGCAITWDKDD
jgi:hypothetical protein